MTEQYAVDLHGTGYVNIQARAAALLATHRDTTVHRNELRSGMPKGQRRNTGRDPGRDRSILALKRVLRMFDRSGWITRNADDTVTIHNRDHLFRVATQVTEPLAVPQSDDGEAQR